MPLKVRAVKPDATPAPKKRGTKTGTTVRRDYLKVCPEPTCPREGEPFAGTAKAVYCSRRCNLAAWRRRQKPAEAAM